MEATDNIFRSKERTRENFFNMVPRLGENPHPPEVRDFYNNWSAFYDNHFEDSYVAPADCADALVRHIGGKTEVSIIDVGAGTGMVGKELQKKGFKKIQAIEPSPGMMEKAKEKDVYKKIYQQYFTDNVTFIKPDTYDVVVSSGAIYPKHIKASVMPEFVRITKPGGLVILSFDNKYEEAMRNIHQLEKSGKWKCLEQKNHPDYFYNGYTGVFYVLKITK